MTAALVPAPVVPSRPAGAGARDLVTLTRRSLLRMLRYPSLTVIVVALPVVLLLMFVYVFGGAFGAGVAPGAAPGAERRAAYLAYVAPTMLVLAVTAAAQSTAITVAMDLTGGIVTRLRTTPVPPAAVLGGHVVGAVLQTVLASALVLAVAVLMGYRPGADAADLLALVGFFLLVAVAITWVAVAMGAAAGTVEEASNTPMVLVLLPFLGSGFVPVDTMPTPVRVVAEVQPFTPIIETLRGLLAGTPVPAGTAWAAVAWCVGLTVLGVLGARAGYRRPRV